MSRNLGIGVMLLTAVTVLLLSLITMNLLGLIAGGDFLITGLAAGKWKAGTPYALGTGLIILASSIPFLFSNETAWLYGGIGVFASFVFVIGALITLLNDRGAKAPVGP